MGTEDLNQADLESRDFTVPARLLRDRGDQKQKIRSHEDTREIKLDLETDIDVGTIDRRTPPERESTIRNLIETGALSIR